MRENIILSTKHLYKKLIDLIDKDYNVNDKFLTEQEICERFGVGRSTVREAARMLQAQNYIETIRGSGTYIKSKPSVKQASIWLIDNKDKLKDYMDVRIAIEVLAIKLFIKRITEEKVRGLKNIQSEFENAVYASDVAKMSALDENFHGYIAKGTENDLIINFNQLLADSFRKYRLSTFSNKSTRKDAIYAHRKILESIELKDTNDAIFNLQNHLTQSVQNAINLCLQKNNKNVYA